MRTHGSRDTAPLCGESAGLCAQHQYHCALTLNWRAATAPQRQATGCVSPDRLVSCAEPSSLCSTKPDRFGPDEHTRRQRHPRMSARVLRSATSSRRTCLVAPRLSRGLTTPLNSEGWPPPLSLPLGATFCIAHLGSIWETSSPVPSRFRGREQIRKQKPKPQGQGNEPRREGQRTKHS